MDEKNTLFHFQAKQFFDNTSFRDRVVGANVLKQLEQNFGAGLEAVGVVIKPMKQSVSSSTLTQDY